MLTKTPDKFRRHLEVLLALSSDSVDSYITKVEEFLSWMKSNSRPIEPASITRDDIEDYLEHLFYLGNSNSTRRTKLTALQHYARFMVYRKVIEEDFTEEIPRPKLKKKFVQKFTKDDIYRLFRTCDLTTEIGLRNAAILICLVFCGLRNGEVIGLTMDDLIDNGNNLDINISDELGKKGSFRTVYLWKSPSIILREWYTTRLGQSANIDDRVFVSYRNGRGVAGNPLSHKDIDNLVKRMVRQAGIRKAKKTAHMFRATHINDLRSIRGYDTPAIADRVGHKDISTTDRYIARRERIHKYYPSLSAYWSEFPNTWNYKEDENG